MVQATDVQLQLLDDTTGGSVVCAVGNLTVQGWIGVSYQEINITFQGSASSCNCSSAVDYRVLSRRSMFRCGQRAHMQHHRISAPGSINGFLLYEQIQPSGPRGYFGAS